MKLLTLRGFSEKSFRAHPKVKVFYSLLDNGGIPKCSQVNNKENFVTQHPDDHIGELRDPFEADQAQRNPYNSGNSMNPYSQRKQGASSFSTNPYQQSQRQTQGYTQAAGRFSPMPQSVPRPPPNSTSSTSPTLTQDQVKRMEESRKRAIAIRMKKQGN